MVKETERRLLRTLEFLKEPRGSRISTIMKAMNGDGPKVSLQKIVKTLRGCVESGVLKVADGRIKLTQLGVIGDKKMKEEKESKSSGFVKGIPSVSPGKNRRSIPKTKAQGEDPPPDAPSPDAQPPPAPECPKCRRKPKRRRCQKQKPKCPKARPKKKCPKSKKPKCPKAKKCGKAKPKKKSKIQPYCQKKKRVSSSSVNQDDDPVYYYPH